ncbi:MAG: hypothetical protein KJ645_07035, partial [Planctomycetes bacterium]|nr:hypothetical protein [Planctomycetota bacterium]
MTKRPAPLSLISLFAPPDASELAAVEADWASRNTTVSGWTIEDYGTDSHGFFVQVVSHLVDGYRHYGLIRYPADYYPSGSFPVLLFNHGGLDGASMDDLHNFDNSFLPGTVMEDNFFYVLASYRGETLDAGIFGTYVSEGDQSVMDHDVDDVIALLNGVLANVSDADGSRVVAYGQSRGGCVYLLLGVRDSRIQLLTELYGPTSWMLPF